MQRFRIDPYFGEVLYFFEARVNKRISWWSLNNVSGQNLFTILEQSYHNFKEDFFKIKVDSNNWSLFGGYPLFWTKSPLVYYKLKK